MRPSFFSDLAQRFMLFTSALGLVGLQVGCDEPDITPNDVPSFGFEYVLEESLIIQGEYGDIVDLSIDDRGDIYAADRLLNRIWRYRPTGEASAPIGGEGEGPGQFTGLAAISTGRRDSLHAFDVRQSRISAFGIEADSASLAYSRTVPHAFGGSAKYDFFVPTQGGFLFLYTDTFREKDLDQARFVRIAHWTGAPDSMPRVVHSVPDKEYLITRDPRFGFSVGPLPYGRYPVVRVSRTGKLYYGWNDELAIDRYLLSGEADGHFSMVLERHPISGTDLKLLLDSFETDAFGRLAREAIEKAIDEGQMPSTKPAFMDFLVDGGEQVWIRRIEESDRTVAVPGGYRYANQGARATWWVISRDGKLLARAEVPASDALEVVVDEFAYGVRTDSLGTQSIVRYEISKQHPKEGI